MTWFALFFGVFFKGVFTVSAWGPLLCVCLACFACRRGAFRRGVATWLIGWAFVRALGFALGCFGGGLLVWFLWFCGLWLARRLCVCCGLSCRLAWVCGALCRAFAAVVRCFNGCFVGLAGVVGGCLPLFWALLVFSLCGCGVLPLPLLCRLRLPALGLCMLAVPVLPALLAV